MEGGRMYSVEFYLRVRLACHVDGLSEREAARRFGIARETVRKMLRHSVPLGYRRKKTPARPKLDPYVGIIDGYLNEDRECGPAFSSFCSGWSLFYAMA